MKTESVSPERTQPEDKEARAWRLPGGLGGEPVWGGGRPTAGGHRLQPVSRGAWRRPAFTKAGRPNKDTQERQALGEGDALLQSPPLIAGQSFGHLPGGAQRPWDSMSWLPTQVPGARCEGNRPTEGALSSGGRSQAQHQAPTGHTGEAEGEKQAEQVAPETSGSGSESHHECLSVSESNTAIKPSTSEQAQTKSTHRNHHTLNT